MHCYACDALPGEKSPLCRSPTASLVTQQYNFCKAAVHSVEASRRSPLDTVETEADSRQTLIGSSGQDDKQLQHVTIATLGQNATAIQIFTVDLAEVCMP